MPRAVHLELTPFALHQQERNQSSPSCLVAGPATASRVAVEILVKWDKVLPTWIVLEQFTFTEHGRRLDRLEEKCSSVSVSIRELLAPGSSSDLILSGTR